MSKTAGSRPGHARRGHSKLLVAEHFPVIRHGIRAILANRPDLVVCSEVGSCTEALDRLRVESFDLLIIAVRLPGVGGIELVKQIRAMHLSTPILVFSSLPEEDYAIRALKAGASGYLTKDAEAEELVRAVDIVVSGKPYVTTTLAERLASQVGNHRQAAPHEALSDRELDVVRSIAEGLTVKQIAHALHLSVSTVSTYRNRALEKMALRTNLDVVRYAMKHDLVE